MTVIVDAYEAELLFNAWCSYAPDTDPGEALQLAIKEILPDRGDVYQANLYSEIMESAAGVEENPDDQDWKASILVSMARAYG